MVEVKDMSMRDWFAGQVLAGLILQAGGSYSGAGNLVTLRFAHFAEQAYDIADALLREKKKRDAQGPGPSEQVGYASSRSAR
jgi:hypothetical protein